MALAKTISVLMIKLDKVHPLAMRYLRLQLLLYSSVYFVGSAARSVQCCGSSCENTPYLFDCVGEIYANY